MKSKILRVALFVCAGIAAMQFGGAWKALSHSNTPGSSLVSRVAKLDGHAFHAPSPHLQSEVSKPDIPAHGPKPYQVPALVAKPGEQKSSFQENREVFPEDEQLFQLPAPTVIAQDNGASFSPRHLGRSGNLPPLLGGFGGSSHSGGGKDKSSDTNPSDNVIPPDSSNSTPPVDTSDSGTGGNDGSSNGNDNLGNGDGNTDNLVPSGFVPPDPSETYTENELPPIEPPVNQGDFNEPPSLPAQGLVETGPSDSPPASRVPDNGLTLVLLGIGFTSLACAKRRMSRR